MGRGMSLDIKMLDGRERQDSLGAACAIFINGTLALVLAGCLSNTSAVVPIDKAALPPASWECQIHTWSCA